MKNIIIAKIVFLFLFSSPFAYSADDDAIGIIKSVSGKVELVSDAASVTALESMDVLLGDTIITGPEAAVGIIFKDDTTVSLGPESEFVMADFHFQPEEEKLSFIARLVKGTLSFLSGQIGKLNPNGVRLETPDATLGVRGTRLLVKVE